MIEIPGWVTVGTAAGGFAMFAGSLLALPWLVRRLPADHFVVPAPRRSLPMTVARNALGVMLLGLGAAMLVLPGQGVLTILLGLSILDLPAKRRLVASILRRRPVAAAIQRIRKRAGLPPLVIPAKRPRRRLDRALQ